MGVFRYFSYLDSRDLPNIIHSELSERLGKLEALNSSGDLISEVEISAIIEDLKLDIRLLEALASFLPKYARTNHSFRHR